MASAPEYCVAVTPELHYCGGSAGMDNVSKAITSGVYKSVMNVCNEKDAPCAVKPVVEGAGLKYANVHADGEKLSFAVGCDVVDALKGLPRPTLVICATGARASAACLLGAAAVREKMPTGEELIKEATEKKLPFLEKPKQVEWVKNFPQALMLDLKQEDPKLFFRQLFEQESGTYTYVLACPETREAVIIDPVLEKLDRDIQYINEWGLKLKYALNTHVHADHITSTGCMKTRLTGFQTVLHEANKSLDAVCDVFAKHGDTIKFGTRHLEVRSTPGHTAGCATYVLDDKSMAFTGDALLIRGCGRTDFQGGNSTHLYRAIWEHVFSLPEGTKLYPGHDYIGRSVTTVGEEKRFNTRLLKGEAAFVELMANLKLPDPKKISIAVPANIKDGVYEGADGKVLCGYCMG